jgi:predicted TIM-barrel fold metal-dependent hydrolase
MPVIDVHAHFEPRMLDLPTMVAKLDAAGVDQVALIPAMQDPLRDNAASTKLLLKAMRFLMSRGQQDLVDRLTRRMYTPEGDLKLRGEIIHIYPLPDNQAVADVIAARPDRFVGWIFLNPAVMDDPVEELERWRQVPGFIGVKLHPHWHGWHIEKALPIARRCEELKLPVLVHLGFGERGRWQVLTDACPKLRLLFAHAGMPWFGKMWDAIRDNPNLHLDVSSPYLDEKLVRRAVAAVGPERALYGTDAPYGFEGADHAYDYTHIKTWVQRLPCTSGEIDRILADNARTLLAERR